MVKANPPGKKPVSESVKGVDNTSVNELQAPAAGRKNGKNGRPAVGGSAVTGAKSTQPKQFTENASQQQQQLESYNREMRRRMERMGYNDEEDKAKKVQEKRKERMERINQRRQQNIAQVKKSLPGGKVDLDTRRVYVMIAVVAVVIVALIVLFVVLRATRVIG